MARIRLIHWNGPEGRERRRQLAALGHQVEFQEVDGPGLRHVLRAAPPDAFVIDLSRLPSHGREVGMALRTMKATRLVPIVFVGGEREKVRRIQSLLPDATYTTWGRVNTSLPRAIARPPAAPVVPPSHIYSGKPAVEKLGLKAGMRVSVLGAPPGFARVLTPLPSGVRLSARPSDASDLYICVVRTHRELAAQLASLGGRIDRQTVWLVWPKKASGVKSELNGNLVRQTGLGSGWVDYKVCAIDDTWSGLAFKRRR